MPCLLASLKGNVVYLVCSCVFLYCVCVWSECCVAVLDHFAVLFARLSAVLNSGDYVLLNLVLYTKYCAACETVKLFLQMKCFLTHSVYSVVAASYHFPPLLSLYHTSHDNEDTSHNCLQHCNCASSYVADV